MCFMSYQHGYLYLYSLLHISNFYDSELSIELGSYCLISFEVTSQASRLRNQCDGGSLALYLNVLCRNAGLFCIHC
jgi:hypothetical protein